MILFSGGLLGRQLGGRLGGGSLLGTLMLPSALTTTYASHQENEENSADEEK